MPKSFLKNYLSELRLIFENVHLEEFQSFVDELMGAYKRSSYIFVCGNGGSGSTASHFACDLNKGVNFGSKKRFRIVSLSDNIPSILAYANDVSYDDVFVEQLKNFMDKNDLVIGISASGNSTNVLRAIDYANRNDGITFGLCGYDGGKLKRLSKKSLVINSMDMQKVEDLHMILIHCVMQYLNQNFTNE